MATWLTSKEASLYLRRSESYLIHLRSKAPLDRQPPYSKNGQQVLYKKEDLDAWLESNKVEAKPAEQVKLDPFQTGRHLK